MTNTSTVVKLFNFDLVHFDCEQKTDSHSDTPSILRANSQDAWDKMNKLAHMYCRTFCKADELQLLETSETALKNWKLLQKDLHNALAMLPLAPSGPCPACALTISIPFLPEFIKFWNADYKGGIWMPNGYPHEADNREVSSESDSVFDDDGNCVAGDSIQWESLNAETKTDDELMAHFNNSLYLKGSHVENNEIFCTCANHKLTINCSPRVLIEALSNHRGSLPQLWSTNPTEAAEQFLAVLSLAQSVACYVRQWSREEPIIQVSQGAEQSEESQGIRINLVLKEDGWHWIVNDKDTGKWAENRESNRVRVGKALFGQIGIGDGWVKHEAMMNTCGWTQDAYFRKDGNSGPIDKELNRLRKFFRENLSEKFPDVEFHKTKGIRFAGGVQRARL